MCTTLRHLYRSKLLTTIINRLGHCESYDFGLELETALAKAIDEVSTKLTPQIVPGDRNEVFHMEWDNLNVLTTTIHGSNVVNSTGGIMIQETKPAADVDNVIPKRCLPLYKRNNTRSLKLEESHNLSPVHIYNRIGPNFAKDDSFIPPTENDEVLTQCMTKYHIWLLARVVGSSGTKQLVPGFGGFVSATGTRPCRKSTIDYFNPINQPFTEYAVIEELLKQSEEATREVGQEYVLNTFDMGGCMKALPYVWRFPLRYQKHVITPGPFHTGMNYIGMITAHKCNGSGYSEILIEAQLVSNGCLNSVLKGKAYSKALFCLKTVSEAMERLLYRSFLDEMSDVNISDPIILLQFIQNITKETMSDTIEDESVNVVLQRYLAYENSVRDGYLGKTAAFWMAVVDHIRLLLMLQFAVKTNNYELFHKCNGQMAELFFAYDGPNYSRYIISLTHHD